MPRRGFLDKSVAESEVSVAGDFYPGVALVEGSNLSVGRGTDKPLEIVAAPGSMVRR